MTIDHSQSYLNYRAACNAAMLCFQESCLALHLNIQLLIPGLLLVAKAEVLLMP